MRAFLEIALAALAVLGLLSLIWMVSGWLLTPIGGRSVTTLIPCSGDGEELEQAVNGLVWLRDGGFLRGKVILADCGLTDFGKAVAETLVLREAGVELCAADKLPQYIKAAFPIKPEKRDEG